MAEILAINLDKKTVSIKGESTQKIFSLLQSLIYAIIGEYKKRGKRTKEDFQLEFIDMIDEHTKHFIKKGKIENKDKNKYSGYIEIRSDAVMFDATRDKGSVAYMISILTYSLFRKERENEPNIIERLLGDLKNTIRKSKPKAIATPLKSFYFKSEEAKKLRRSGKAEHTESIYSDEDCRHKVKKEKGYLIVEYRDVVEGMYIPDVVSRFREGDIIAIRERYRKDEEGKIHLFSECTEDESSKYKWSTSGCKAEWATQRGRIDEIKLTKGEGGGLSLLYLFSRA